SGTEADGHGNHQLAGFLTPIALEAAANPPMFPEHLAEGLRPWTVRKFYRGQRFRPEPGTEPTLMLPTGVFDAALGRTFFQIAMEGRSQHKTQEMGAPLLHGPQASGLRLVTAVQTTPVTGDEQSVFDGIDVSIRGLAALAGLPDGALAAPLEAMDAAASAALAEVDVRNPAALLPVLARGLDTAREARAALRTIQASADAKAEADFLLAQKVRQWEEALLHASGVIVDAVAMSETIVPGGSTTVSVRAFAPDGSPVAVAGLDVVVPDPATAGRLQAPMPAEGASQAPSQTPALRGWRIDDTDAPTPAATNMYARFFREQPTQAVHKAVTAPSDARPTQPYWLIEPGTETAFTWPEDGPKSVPFGPPVLAGRATLTIESTRVDVYVPVVHRQVDRVRGELRRPLAVVPALSVAITPGLDLVRLSDRTAARDVTVRVESLAPEAVDGTVALDLPAGWSSE